LESERLHKLVLDLISISKGAIFIEEEAKKIVMKGLINSICDDMKIKAQKYSLTLIRDIEEGYIFGQENKIKQLIINIIDNAIKYTATGSITISLKYDATANTFITDVTDTGPGISPEELVKLFEKFIRGNAGKSSKGGSGLGLYLGKRIVELHHGSISVTSPGLGKGSTFSVILPKPTL